MMLLLNMSVSPLTRPAGPAELATGRKPAGFPVSS
jgi:hypothetical protein